MNGKPSSPPLNGATWRVGGKAAQTQYYVYEQAERIGLPLTHAVTINFGLTALNPRLAVPAFRQLRNNFLGKWARRPGKGRGPAFAPTWSYAFENVRDGIPFLTMEPGDPHNVHVHALFHVPPSRSHDFEGEFWRWVEAVTGGILDERAVRIGPAPGPNGYLVKGAAPVHVAIYGRGRDAEPQGIILGRRCEASRNLGPTARIRADRAANIRRRPFRPRLTVDRLDQTH